MSRLLNVALGYDENDILINKLRSMFVVGLPGAGKTYYLKGVINSIINLNKEVGFHIYCYNTTEMNIDGMHLHKSYYDDDIVTRNKNNISILNNVLLHRLNLYQTGSVKYGEFKPMVFVFDNVLRDVINDEATMHTLRQVLTYEKELNIHFIITSQSHEEFGEEFVNSVPIKIAHKSLLETSKALFNSDVASAADFYRNHKIAYMLKGETKPTVIDTITLEDKNVTKCLAISNNL